MAYGPFFEVIFIVYGGYYHQPIFISFSRSIGLESGEDLFVLAIHFSVASAERSINTSFMHGNGPAIHCIARMHVAHPLSSMLTELRSRRCGCGLQYSERPLSIPAFITRSPFRTAKHRAAVIHCILHGTATLRPLDCADYPPPHVLTEAPSRRCRM